MVVDLSVPPAMPEAAVVALGPRLVSADALAQADVDASEAGSGATASGGRLDDLVAQTAAEFVGWLRARDGRTAAEALVRRAELEREAELEQLWRRHPELQPELRDAIERMTESFAKRLLREPLERLGRDTDGRQRARGPGAVRRMTERRSSIGTRGSRLALAQAELVVQALERAGVLDPDLDHRDRRRSPGAGHGVGRGRVRRGDRASAAGRRRGRGGAQREGRADRRGPRDCASARTCRARIRATRSSSGRTRRGAGSTTCRPGSRVGTDSPRRTGFVLARRPDLVVHPLHGNVDTRLRRLDAGETDALVLACAGLDRLGPRRPDRRADRARRRATRARPGRDRRPGPARRPARCSPAVRRSTIPHAPRGRGRTSIPERLAAAAAAHRSARWPAWRATSSTCSAASPARTARTPRSPDGVGRSTTGATLARELAAELRPRGGPELGAGNGRARTTGGARPAVLVTRAADQAAELVAALRRRGPRARLRPGDRGGVPPIADAGPCRRAAPDGRVRLGGGHERQRRPSDPRRGRATPDRRSTGCAGPRSGRPRAAMLDVDGIEVVVPAEPERARPHWPPSSRSAAAIGCSSFAATSPTASSRSPCGRAGADGRRRRRLPDARGARASRALLRAARWRQGRSRPSCFTSGSTVRGLVSLARSEGLDVDVHPAVCIGPETADDGPRGRVHRPRRAADTGAAALAARPRSALAPAATGGSMTLDTRARVPSARGRAAPRQPLPIRPRRLRRTPALRALVRETRLHPVDARRPALRPAGPRRPRADRVDAGRQARLSPDLAADGGRPARRARRRWRHPVRPAGGEGSAGGSGASTDDGIVQETFAADPRHSNCRSWRSPTRACASTPTTAIAGPLAADGSRRQRRRARRDSPRRRSARPAPAPTSSRRAR